ncbi:MAG TPA: shikimate dehydrogenase [Rhizomicrobium sp.]
MPLTGAGKIAGVIGWPVSHALSPLLQGYWLAEHGIDGAMVPLTAAPENFSAVIRGVRLAGFRGVNVTVPHKEAAFALADCWDAAAEAAGAANLLLFRADEKVEACNTDEAGFTASLMESMSEGALAGKKIVVLGAGGAARGIVRALSAMGAGEIAILARSTVRAQGLAAALGPGVKAKLSAGDFSAWPETAKNAVLLVNATSAGMKAMAALELPLEPLPQNAFVCDIVYNPLQTDLLRRASARGHPVIDGLGMLMHQAVPSFRAFFGIEPKVTPALRKLLEDALG